MRQALLSVKHSLADEEFIGIFGNAVDRVIGPAYQGYIDAADFQPVTSLAGLLSAIDEPALGELAAACDEQEWGYSDIPIAHHPIFGIYRDGLLVAASTYRVETSGVALPGIITPPRYRGQGYGKTVLSAATEHGLGEGLLMLYHTLTTNKAAIAVAESLGYKHYATHLAVRLHW